MRGTPKVRSGAVSACWQGVESRAGLGAQLLDHAVTRFFTSIRVGHGERPGSTALTHRAAGSTWLVSVRYTRSFALFADRGSNSAGVRGAHLTRVVWTAGALPSAALCQAQGLVIWSLRSFAAVAVEQRRACSLVKALVGLLLGT